MRRRPRRRTRRRPRPRRRILTRTRPPARPRTGGGVVGGGGGVWLGGVGGWAGVGGGGVSGGGGNGRVHGCVGDLCDRGERGCGCCGAGLLERGSFLGHER